MGIYPKLLPIQPGLAMVDSKAPKFTGDRGFYSTMQLLWSPAVTPSRCFGAPRCNNCGPRLDLLQAIALGSALPGGATTRPAAPAGRDIRRRPSTGPWSYFKGVRPIRGPGCYGCHGPKKQKADLRLAQEAARQETSDGLKVIEARGAVRGAS
jgi:hypothetical protein